MYKYKYNGKELQEELGLNMYDYGARNYDPALGRWMNYDPLAEKYFSKTPYMYCNNNPVLYIDPNGMYFTESSYQYINPYRSNLNDDKKKNNNTIADLTKKIAKGGSEKELKKWRESVNKLSKKNSEIDTKLFEIDLLEQSNQLYHIQESNMPGGVTGFVSGAVVVSIPNSGYSKDLFEHELKHAYQFEVGELSLSQTDDARSFLYDKTDEVEGYKRGGENYGLNNLPSEYQNLPTGPLNIHNNPEIQKALQEPNEEKRKVLLQNISNKEKSAFRVDCQTYRNY